MKTIMLRLAPTINNNNCIYLCKKWLIAKNQSKQVSLPTIAA